MTAIVEQKIPQDSQVKSQIPPSVLLIGKKRTLDYVAPALSRINNTGELIIKATGSLSIVTAVDVAEIVKRDVTDIKTESVTIGTDELRVSTGELKRMSCIQIHLIKYSPIAVAQPEVDVHVPIEETAVPSPVIEIPIEEAISPVKVDVPVVITEKAKKLRVKRKAAAAKKKTTRKKKSIA
ncbi:MAG: hypothetical protein AB1351_05355 [Thermoproteota archaeon]